jgi:hypothetical protein
MTLTNAKLRRIASVLLLATIWVSMVQAAEKIRWEDLNQRFADIRSDEHAAVVMKNGTRLRGLIVGIRPTELEIWIDNTSETAVARENVARIIFRRKTHYLEKILENLAFSLIAPALVFVPELQPAAILTPIMWAHTAVSTPVLLIAQGASWLGLKPRTVMEIVQ